MRGGVAELTLDRPPANALNLDMVTQLRAAHAQACAAGARAVILTGRAGMFSGGLDVPELLPLSRAAITDFWLGFCRLTQSLAASPVPVIAAVSGHAPAGGAVLAIYCDYRIGARGPFKIGLNEVAVGLAVPDGILLALERLVGARHAQRLAMTGELIPVEDALGVGLLDELAEPDRLLEQAHAMAQKLGRLPPAAMNRTRLRARARLVEALDPEADARLAAELWFSQETQAGLRALVERLKKK